MTGLAAQLRGQLGQRLLRQPLDRVAPFQGHQGLSRHQIHVGGTEHVGPHHRPRIGREADTIVDVEPHGNPIGRAQVDTAHGADLDAVELDPVALVQAGAVLHEDDHLVAAREERIAHEEKETPHEQAAGHQHQQTQSREIAYLVFHSVLSVRS